MLPPQEIVGLGVCQSPEGRKCFQRMTVRENLELGAYLRRDSAQIDKFDIHVDVETVDRKKYGYKIDVINHKAEVKYDRKKKRYYAYVKLEAPKDAKGWLTLVTKKYYETYDGYKVRPVIGKAKYNLEAGDDKRIKVYLSKGFKAYYKKGKIAVIAQSYGKDGSWGGEKLSLKR